MWLRPLGYDDALYVAERLRERDKREVYATRWHEDPREVAAEAVAAGAFTWCAGAEQPIAVVGAAPLWPGVWGVFLYATDEFRRVAIGVTRHIKRVMIPSLVEIGCHRAETISLLGHVDAHAWLEILGAHREGVLRSYGKHSEDFVTYVWHQYGFL